MVRFLPLLAANPAFLAAALVAVAQQTRMRLALRELPSFHVGYGDGCTTSNEEDKSFSTKIVSRRLLRLKMMTLIAPAGVRATLNARTARRTLSMADEF